MFTTITILTIVVIFLLFMVRHVGTQVIDSYVLISKLGDITMVLDKRIANSHDAITFSIDSSQTMIQWIYTNGTPDDKLKIMKMVNKYEKMYAQDSKRPLNGASKVNQEK